MSGPFFYHLKCSNCGLTGGTFEHVKGIWEPGEKRYPLSNPESKCFESTSDPEARGCVVSSPVLSGEEIHLMPPLPCPSCGYEIETATWGSPPQTIRGLTTVSNVIRETRNIPDAGNVLFRSDNHQYTVNCLSDHEEGAKLIRWYVRRTAGSTVDLEPVLRAIIAQLEAIGSDCTTIRVRERTARFIEIPKRRISKETK